MDSRDLAAAVKQEGLRLGFELIGITTPDPPPHLDIYRRWLAEARHGAMHYLASDRGLARRADPRQILPECRSIVVVGIRHALPSLPTPDGRVAGYAQGADYHRVVVDRLERLMRFLEPLAESPFTYRLYSDTGPILERELASRAGLGWIGKNTCLIHPQHGSYFLLGEALISQDLEADGPFETDQCGSCTRCLDACPTGCILPDRTLDARRCLSYLTIEQRGPIPADLRPAVGDWLFGCDICQQVCPWNIRFAGPTDDPDFRPRGQAPAAAYLAPAPPSLSGTAMNRARRSGVARNAAVVLGNRGDPSDLPALLRALRTNPDPIVRGHAAWALGRLGGDQAQQGLIEAEAHERDPEARKEIRAARRYLGASG